MVFLKNNNKRGRNGGFGMKKRVFLIVLDSFGIGEMDDAKAYGDKGTNTIGSVSESAYFQVPNLKKLGLFNIEGVTGRNLEKTDAPLAAVARMREASKGKDTTIGHWEIAGMISDKPLPTYPNGFPKEVLDEFSRITGRGVLCNSTYSGTEVIRDYGDEHVKTGDLIVYTSADSVFQIAAHEDVVPLETLYDYCKKAREIALISSTLKLPKTSKSMANLQSGEVPEMTEEKYSACC